MKVICEYCGSYVDVGENSTCPNCGVPLAGSIKTEQEKVLLQIRYDLEKKINMLEFQNAIQKSISEIRPPRFWA